MKNKLPETCTIREAAEMFKLGSPAVVRLIRMGVLPAAKISGKYVILVDDVIKFYKSKIVLPDTGRK